MWPPPLDLREQMKQVSQYRRKASPLSSALVRPVLSSSRRQTSFCPVHKARKRSRSKSTRKIYNLNQAPPQPTHHFLGRRTAPCTRKQTSYSAITFSIAELDGNFPILDMQRRKRRSTQKKRSKKKSTAMVELEERELKIAKALQSSLKTHSPMTNTPETIIQHASKRLSQKGKRLSDSWVEVISQLDVETQRTFAKGQHRKDRSYRILKQQQKKDLKHQIDTLAYRQEMKRRQREVALQNMPTPVRNNASKQRRANNDFFHLAVESRRVFGKGFLSSA